MATLNRADLSDAMSLIYQDNLVDQFRRDIVLLNLLKVVPGRNDSCVWPVKFEGRTAGGAYAEGADMADQDFDSHTRVQGMLPWAQYRKGAKVSGLAQAVVGAGGYAYSGDVIDEELVDATDALAVEIGADLYAGNPGASPPELAGAALAIDGSAGTFAGIDSTTHGDWLAGEDTAVLADLTPAVIRTKLFRPVKDATGMDPEFVTVPGAIMDALKEVLGEKAETIQQVRTNARGGVDIFAATGARAVSIDGVPFIEDRHCTAGTMYAWHSRFVEIRQVPAVKNRRDPNRIVAAIRQLTGVDMDVSEVEARLRAGSGVLTPAIEFLAQTGDATKAMVKVYAQLAWKRRNAFAKLTVT